MATTPTPQAILTAGGTTEPRWLLRGTPSRVETARDPRAARDLLDRIAAGRPAGRPTDRPSAPQAPPFRSGWAVSLSYDLGRHLEPAAAGRNPPPPDRDTPLLVAARLDAVEPCTLPASPDLADQQDRSAGEPSPPLSTSAVDQQASHFTDRVRAVLDLIRAGDVYQVNLTDRFSAEIDLDHRALARCLFTDARPAHGCLIEWPNAHGGLDALVSASPELFLAYDPATRMLRTRPMKGTRPAHADPAELDAAEKDRAELAMIVDLMRNDLTRVCAIPSVRIEQPRTVDTHAGSVHQATATIAGTLRTDLTLADAITATFPPGSVTGAPKIRAMQIIDDLEAAPRGLYCGVAGWIDDTGRAELSVTIRAAIVSGPAGARTVDLHAGAGIVADSVPDDEWRETLLKTEVIRRALAATARPEPAAPAAPTGAPA